MSEGKYGRLPKPKDRSGRKVSVSLGDIELTPTHDKAGEWEEEGEALTAHTAHSKASSPWARLLGKKDEDDE